MKIRSLSSTATFLANTAAVQNRTLCALKRSKMQSATSPTNNNLNLDNIEPVPRSEQIVSDTLQKGFEKMLVQTSAGLLLGGLAGLVLVRGRGGSTAARKGLAGLGAGLGLGSAWTRTSMDLEELLSSNSNSNAK